MMAYRCIEKFYPENEIIIVDDGSTDGTEDWLLGSVTKNGEKHHGQIDFDDNLRGWRNTTGKPLGEATLIDMGIKMARNPMVSVFQRDVDYSEKYLESLLNKWTPKSDSLTIISKDDYLTYGKNHFLYSQ